MLKVYGNMDLELEPVKELIEYHYETKIKAMYLEEENSKGD